MRKKQWRLQIIGVCLMILFLCSGCKKQEVLITQDDTEESEEMQQDSLKESKDAKIFVYLCGEVVNPGVYELDAESRVCDGIAAAGGLTEAAAADLINQAEHLEDGQMIKIPSMEEIQSQAEEEDKSGLVNINQAGAEELMTLPGIGQSKADAIISYREKNGSFKNTEEIMNISGIKEKAYEKIKDSITVN